MFEPTDLFGAGSLKMAAKAINHITGGACEGVVNALEEFTSSTAYQHHRFENLQDKLSEFWNDHEEDVTNFIDSAGDTIGDCLDNAGDTIIDIITGIFS